MRKVTIECSSNGYCTRKATLSWEDFLNQFGTNPVPEMGTPTVRFFKMPKIYCTLCLSICSVEIFDEEKVSDTVKKSVFKKEWTQ